MYVQKRGWEKLAIRAWQWLFLFAVLSSLAAAQDTAAQKPAPAGPAATGVRPESYVIGAEDTLSIYVWKEPDMSKSVPVRPDGMISLPLVGEIKAAGYTPVQLQGVLAEAMKRVISDPQVTVVVEKIASLSFNIVGEVNHPGYFPLTRRMTVLDAIALSGGFKDFAKVKKVYVLRTGANGTQERLPFNYKEVIAGKNPQQNIELQPRDTIVVP
ncbi:MAG TPA: polysaccharide biosynthesis/export family protein [Candidatus Bathyarchaeia archaeon]|nr:polysaccharide biosynthesis/export family protein [Candidatus Bathyarchaeia archaeon]